MEDRELIHRIQRGQKELLNVIAEKYYDDIYRFCLYLTGQPEDSYDLTQETFYRLIRYVEHYRYKNLRGYLLTIARNLCTDYFRGQKDIARMTGVGLATVKSRIRQGTEKLRKIMNGTVAETATRMMSMWRGIVCAAIAIPSVGLAYYKYRDHQVS